MSELNKILAIDPSSSMTGYAVLNEQERLLEAGLLKPNKQRDPPAERIAAMCGDLWTLLDHTEPAAVVIEWTSGHVGQKRHQGGGAGLSVYGIAIGAIWQTAVHWAASHPKRKTRIELINENDWTGGKPKPERTGMIARLYPQYELASDPGGDVADAIGLGRWWICEKRFKLLSRKEGE